MEDGNFYKKLGVKFMKKNGIIFGKFYPIHMGHVDFIQKASGFVDRLYVVVCSDDTRDKELFEKSKMKKMPTIKDRLNFVESIFKYQNNIKIIHLAEDGIPFYPNGWKLWSKRVFEVLLKNDIKVDVIFSNEPQDVENYKNNFLTLPNFEKVFNKNLEIQTIDINRDNFPISATEVRNSPYHNWDFMPKPVQEFFTIKVAIIGTPHSGKTTLVHKLSNCYNTTFVKDYKKEYSKRNHLKNLEEKDFNSIAQKQQEIIFKSVKNSNKLVFIDTEFCSLQADLLKLDKKENETINNFIKNEDFELIFYIENEKKSDEMKKFDSNLKDILEKNNKKIIELKLKNNNFTEIYNCCLEYINKIIE